MCLAIPGKVIEVFEDHGLRMGRVDFGGTVKKACLAQLPEAGVGDYVARPCRIRAQSGGPGRSRADVPPPRRAGFP